MNERLKRIRKELDLSQEEFGLKKAKEISQSKC